MLGPKPKNLLRHSTSINQGELKQSEIQALVAQVDKLACYISMRTKIIVFAMSTAFQPGLYEHASPLDTSLFDSTIIYQKTRHFKFDIKKPFPLKMIKTKFDHL